MARSKNKILDLSSALLQQGKTALGTQPETTSVTPLPVSELPMVLTLDELAPNPDNPRTSRNPKYEEIKASIQARGLDTVPKVTRDPEAGSQVYIFSDGGNTRYQILCELWQETGEERFYRFPCLFKPWPGRLSCVIGHLAENDVRGDLSFIEKALGIRKARSIYEEQLGKCVTLRELSSLLAAEGYPVHFSGISRMEDTVKYLYPSMPALLESGLGAPQIRQLLSLRSDAEKTWKFFANDVSTTRSFDEVFAAVCRHFDAPEMYSLDMFRDELIGALVEALPHPSLNYDRWLLELDPKEQNRRKHLGEPTSLSVQSLEIDDSLPSEGSPEEKSSQLPPDVAEHPGDQNIAPTALGSALFDSDGKQDNTSEEQQEETPAPSFNTTRVETQPDLYGAPAILSGETGSASGSAPLPDNDEVLTRSPFQPPHLVMEPQQDNTEHSEVAFAEVGLEPVGTIWAIPTLQDDIEHLQVMTFRLAFELAEVAGCEAEIKADRSGLYAAGYELADLHLAAGCIERPSPFTVFLLSLAGADNIDHDGCSLGDVLIGTERAADLPLLDDIHAVKLMRLIRVMRRLRELQRDVPATEDNS
ncbi:ParB family protein [Pectobacterium sp. CHL-2024]|uniref:ParB family protein n=1 Tax=Pectobacterium sp. CHL-2024 TaxID=3377079 RepID=UPI0038189B77